jgi:hypothetical protein
MTGRRTGEVTTEMVLDGEPGSARRTVVRLSWHRGDPLAVNVSVVTQPDHPSLPPGDWGVLRDFLRYGMEVPTGDGPVRIQPEGDGTFVRIALDGGGRPCVLRLASRLVRDFLDRTELVLPAGEERSALDLDALIARLLQT